MSFLDQTSLRGGQGYIPAIFAGLVGAWLWLLYESSALAWHVEGWSGASGLVALSALLWALIMIVVVKGLEVARSRLFPWLRAAHLLTLVLVLVMTSQAALLGARSAPSLFSSRQIMDIFIGLSAPCGALVAWGVVLVWRRLMKGDLGWRGAWVLGVVMLASWCVLVATLYPEAWAGLELRRLIGGGLAIIGTTGSVIFLPKRAAQGREVVIIAVMALLLVSWAGFGLFAVKLQRHALTLQRHAPSTWLVMGHLVRRPAQVVAQIKPSLTSATCRRGQPAPAPGSWRVTDEAPNIILVTVDALRWDHTSLGGYERDTTPHLKRWASKAAVMTQAYTPATSTRQTFGALFTGVHPSLLTRPPAPRWSLSLPEGQETVASWLSAAGYDTHAIVVSSKVFQEETRALHGFKTIDVSPRQWWSRYGYGSALQVERVISALSSLESDAELESMSEVRPKFIWTHLMEAHQNYHSGPEPKDYGRSPQDRYDAAIHYIDEELDRLLLTALSPARRQNTYVILTADHGHAFREHGQRFHGHTVYNEELHVPLMIWGPRVKAGRRDEPTAVLSVFATIMELAGSPASSLGFACEGSLLNELEQRAEPNTHDIYVEQLSDDSNERAGLGLIRGDYKLVVSPLDRSVELFNLVEDPQEQRDLSVKDRPLAQRLLLAMIILQRERGIDPQALGMFELELSPAKEAP